MRVKDKKEESSQTPKTSSSKKQRKSQNLSKQLIKFDLNLLSKTFYCPKQKSSSKKVLFYDQFQSQKHDIDGAITSRFLPHKSNGDTLAKCKKIQNLSPKLQAGSKRKMPEQVERRANQVGIKNKEKNQMQSKRREQSLRPQIMGLAYDRKN